MTVEDLQRVHLARVASWARKLRQDLLPVPEQFRGKLHFRPGSNSVAMIGLRPDRPQRGKSGFKDLHRLRDRLEELYYEHCVEGGQGRDTPEKRLQSYLIREAYLNKRRMRSIEQACVEADEPLQLLFVVDEIPLPISTSKRIVCDILALRPVPGDAYRPVLLELKSSRAKTELVRQVNAYAELVDQHRDGFGSLFSALFRAGEIGLDRSTDAGHY